MPFCNNCGRDIEFRYVDGRCIPFHLDGQSCSGSGGVYFGGGGYGTYSSFRSTSDGGSFEFPFVTYPSYVNPNAICPVPGCGKPVYFYQSPYGGRVFFDELGPPWPKHPCTDNSIVQKHFSSAEGRARILVAQPTQSEKSNSETDQNCKVTPVEPRITDAMPSRLSVWAEAGWMPFVVTKIISRPMGIEAEGKLFTSAGSEPVSFRIIQASIDAKYYRTQGQLRIGSDLIQNVSRILSVLNECPILLKKEPDLQHLTLSSFILTREGEVEEITLSVFGTEIGQFSSVAV
jgi:hypothetical protein